NDARILQNMAIAFTKTRRIDEAIRHYRRALELERDLAGAHYGLAFLLLKRGDPDGATQHLRAFLAHPPKGPDAQRWIEHATQALRDLGGGGGASGPTQAAAAEGPWGLPFSSPCSPRPRRARSAPISRATSPSRSPPPTASRSTTRSSPRHGS